MTTEVQLKETQYGFRKGKGVQDNIFVFKQLVKKNSNDNIFVPFIDIEKALDRIPRDLLGKP